jgi:Cu(I)/Ag(I) efflux system membrane protein CusA/SilA
MIERIIESCARNRGVVFLAVIGLVLASVYAIRHIPLDAIPDLSDTQVIVWTEWMGRGPGLVEDQVTYPLVSSLVAAPRVKTVRGYSMFGMSFVYILFEDGTDLYWARSRVLEYLNRIRDRLPQGVNPVLGPDATGVGWVYQYALVDDSGRHDLSELRSLQDFWVKYALESVPGVAEVASVGGFQRQYQVTLDPERLKAYNMPIATIVEAIRRSNNDVGGRVVEMSGREYVVRGLGYLRSTGDLEQVVVGEDGRGTPVRLRDVARVAVGPEIRRGAADLDGQGEVVGGIVVMRHGENALNVIRRVKDRLENSVIPSLPEGVRLVTTYDRSELILASIRTLTDTLLEEAVVVSLVIVIFLLHVRSALVAIVTLPVAVLVSFIPMLFLGLTSNIMSLGGIAIAIGAMVDASIVLIENAHKKLEHAPPDADRLEGVIAAAKEVGRPIFFSLLLISVSFLPVFTLQGQGGRLFLPLAYTKTAAMFFAAVLSITLAPALMALLIRGKIFRETEHPVSRVLIGLYRPFVYVALHNPKTTLLLAAAALASAVPLGLRLGSEFMPPLNEGTLLYMPTTMPGISIEEAKRSLQIQDRIIASFPEVERVFGKVGRAETPTDPAGLDMIETTILLKPRDGWRKVSAKRWYSSWAPEWLAGPLRRIWPEQRPMTWEELARELNRSLNVPGWTNSLSPPIKTRIDMLTTGIRTPIGVKVYGADLNRIQEVAGRLEEVLRPLEGTRGVFAERPTGGFYLDIVPNREVIARYGLNVGDVQDVVEASLGGLVVTRTVEGRERYTVNVRYPRESRANLESVRRILVPVRASGGSPAGMGGGGQPGMSWLDGGAARGVPGGILLAQAGMQGMGGGAGGAASATGGGGPREGSVTDVPLFRLPRFPAGAELPGAAGMEGAPGGGGPMPIQAPGPQPAETVAMVPLGELAEVTLRSGPPMIKDENGSLVGYVYVDVDTSRRDIGGYVQEAKEKVRSTLGALPGVRIEWTGQYELLERMQARLRVVIPLTLGIIVLLLYLNFRSWVQTGIVMLSVPFALVGSVWLLFFLGYHTSVAVWVGVIALAGVAAETGIVMILYLDEFYHKYRAEGRMRTAEDVRRAVMDGAALRVRPKLMTVSTTILGLLPLLWAQGTGADVMGRIAAPMVGGLVTSAFLTLEIIPVVYLYWRRLELRGEVARACHAGFHVLAGLVELGLGLGTAWPFGVRAALLVAGIASCGLAVVLWRGGRIGRPLLAVVDLAVGAGGAWALLGRGADPLWLIGPGAVLLAAFSLLSPAASAALSGPPRPEGA